MADLIPVEVDVRGIRVTVSCETTASPHFVLAPLVERDGGTDRFTGDFFLYHLPTGKWAYATWPSEDTPARLRRMAELLAEDAVDWSVFPPKGTEDYARYRAAFKAAYDTAIDEEFAAYDAGPDDVPASTLPDLTALEARRG